MPDTMLIQSAITELPLPLAQTLRRAANAKSPQEQHNGAYYFFESALKLSAAAQIGVYVSQGCAHAPLNAQLENLVRPSVGQWLALLRETAAYLAGRADAALLPLAGVHERLTRRQALPAVRAFLDFAGEAMGRQDGRQALSVLDFFDAAVAYRNHELGHGAMRGRDFYAQAAPLLLEAALEALAQLKPTGQLQFAVTRDVVDPRTQKAERRFDVLRGDGLHIPMDASLPQDLALAAGRLVLAAGSTRVGLHPLLVYEIDKLDRDRVGFLNHVTAAGRGDHAKFKRVEFLDYDSGDRLAGHDALAELAALLSKLRGIAVSADTVEQLSRGGTEILLRDAPSDSGQFIGDFELIEELGRGGMGIVYKARQHSLRRIVALKVLPPALAGDPVSVARFRREVAALGRCDHPNVVKVLTAGQDGERHFYAMEYVEGSDLAQICEVLSGWKAEKGATPQALKEGDIIRAVGHSRLTRAYSGQKAVDSGMLPPMPKAEPLLPQTASGRDYFLRLAEILGDAASGVQHLHEHGIIHRDLKPANIMLTQDGKRAVIMDLGLAQLQDRSLSLTASTVRVIGTLRYMPPEQLQHRMLEVTPRADIYSLGATLYELATLAPMFDGDTEARLMQQVLQEEPKAPSRVNAAVPRDLETIITVATAKAPAERYASAAILASDLRAFSRGEPISARPPSTFHYLKLFYRKNKALVHGMAVAAALMLALATWFIVQLDEKRAEAERLAREADESAKVARSETERANKARREATENETRANEAKKDANKAEKKATERAEEARRNLAPAHLEKSATARGQGRMQSAAAQMGAAWLKDERVVDKTSLLSALDQGRGPIWRSADVMAGFTGVFALARKGTLVIGPSGNDCLLWDTATGALLRALEGHKDLVLCVAVSEDASLALSGGRDGSLRLWRLEGGDAPVLAGHRDSVNCVALTADKAHALSGGEDGLLCLWDAATGALLASSDAQGSPIVSMAVDAGRQAVLCGGRDGSLWMFDARTLKPTCEFPGHRKRAGEAGTEISGIAFNARGTLAATAGADGTVRVWQLATRTLAHKFVLSPIGKTPVDEKAGAAAKCVAFSPISDLLLAGGADNFMRLWDVARKQLLHTFAQHSDVVRSVAFSEDGEVAFSGCIGQRLQLWNMASGERIRVFEGHTGRVLCTAFSPDGKLVASGSDDMTLRLWEAQSGRPLKVFSGHTHWVRAVAFSRDGRYLLSGSYDETMRLWDIETGKQAGEPFIMEEAAGRGAGEPAIWITCVSFSPDGRQVLSGCTDQKARLWDVASRKMLRKFEGDAQSAVFSPRGRYVVSGGASVRQMKLWDLQAQAEASPRTFERRHKDGIRCLAFSPDEKFIASGGIDSKLCLWNVEDGKWIRDFTGHTERVECCAFSNDGSQIFSGSEDGTIRQWLTESGTCLRAYEGHTSSAYCLALSPSGRFAVCGSWDCTLSMWDLQEGRAVRTIKARADRVLGVDFGPGGELAAAGYLNGFMQVFDVKQGIVKGTYILPAAENEDPSPIRCVAFSRDGKLVACGNATGFVAIWDVTQQRGVTSISTPKYLFRRPTTGAITSVALSDDGAFVLAGSEDHFVARWSLATGEEVGNTELGDWVTKVAFCADGQCALCACGPQCQKLYEWHFARRSVREILMGPGTKVECAAFTRDGQFALTGSINGDIQLWDLRAERIRFELIGHRAKITSLAFSADGLFALSGSADGALRLWSLTESRAEDRARYAFEAHTEAVASATFDDSGRFAISGSHDESIRIWDLSGAYLPSDLSVSEPVVELLTAQRVRDLLPGATWPPVGKFAWSGARPAFLQGQPWPSPLQQQREAALRSHRWLASSEAARLARLTAALDEDERRWDDRFEGYRYREVENGGGRVPVAPRSKDDSGKYVGRPEGYVDFAKWWDEVGSKK